MRDGLAAELLTLRRKTNSKQNEHVYCFKAGVHARIIAIFFAPFKQAICKMNGLFCSI